jgi:hypothetical protein
VVKVAVASERIQSQKARKTTKRTNIGLIPLTESLVSNGFNVSKNNNPFNTLKLPDLLIDAAKLLFYQQKIAPAQRRSLKSPLSYADIEYISTASNPVKIKFTDLSSLISYTKVRDLVLELQNNHLNICNSITTRIENANIDNSSTIKEALLQLPGGKKSFENFEVTKRSNVVKLKGEVIQTLEHNIYHLIHNERIPEVMELNLKLGIDFETFLGVLNRAGLGKLNPEPYYLDSLLLLMVGFDHETPRKMELQNDEKSKSEHQKMLEEIQEYKNFIENEIWLTTLGNVFTSSPT